MRSMRALLVEQIVAMLKPFDDILIVFISVIHFMDHTALTAAHDLIAQILYKIAHLRLVKRVQIINDLVFADRLFLFLQRSSHNVLQSVLIRLVPFVMHRSLIGRRDDMKELVKHELLSVQRLPFVAGDRDRNMILCQHRNGRNEKACQRDCRAHHHF